MVDWRKIIGRRLLSTFLFLRNVCVVCVCVCVREREKERKKERERGGSEINSCATGKLHWE